MTMTKLVSVAHEWMGLGFDFEVSAKHSRLRVIDPGPLFLYRQHGRNHVSREPLAHIEFQANDGPWRGAARLSDLRAAGVATVQRSRGARAMPAA
jgi:hypothetical protein